MLNDAAGHYQKFKIKPGESIHKETLYMENKYAVKIFMPGTYQYNKDAPYNAPLSILNSYIDVLNEPQHAKIPHTIVILWNDHKFWNNSLILKKHMVKVLHKFVKELKKITEIRNFALPEKAANWNNPRIFISNPLPLPNNMIGGYPTHFKSNRRRFTRLLQKSSAKEGYIMINFEDFTCDNKNNFFNKNGTIAEDGFAYLWTAVSDQIQKNDTTAEIAARKIKAKQLAAAVKDNSNQSQDSDSEISGVWDSNKGTDSLAK